jgi:soluble lytic murein transglycosylase-like protein
MQVMGETAREQGFDRPFLSELYLPENAIAHGAMLLKKLLTRYRGDTLAAISAYNSGSARRSRRGMFANARYVYRVAIAWRAYDELWNGAAR